MGPVSSLPVLTRPYGVVDVRNDFTFTSSGKGPSISNKNLGENAYPGHFRVFSALPIELQKYVGTPSLRFVAVFLSGLLFSWLTYLFYKFFYWIPKSIIRPTKTLSVQQTQYNGANINIYYPADPKAPSMLAYDHCFITAFFDIGRAKWVNNPFQRSNEKYIEHFRRFLTLKYDDPLIIFIDNSMLNPVTQLIKEYRSHYYTLIIPINERFLEQHIWAWKQLEKETSIMNSEQYKQLIAHRIHHPEHHNPKYTLVNHAKIDFVVWALDMVKQKHQMLRMLGKQGSQVKNGDGMKNKEEFERYSWIDFGYLHQLHYLPQTQCHSSLIPDYGSELTPLRPVEPPTALKSASYTNSSSVASVSASAMKDASPYHHYPRYHSLPYLDELPLNKITYFIMAEMSEVYADPYYIAKAAPDLTTGGFFSGSPQILREYQEVYHITVLEHQEMNIANDDQDLIPWIYYKKSKQTEEWNHLNFIRVRSFKHALLYLSELIVDGGIE
jgi:hypothetical protein